MPTLDQLRGDVRAKAIAFLFCVGVLSDILGVVDRLDSVLPIVAAFVPLAALAGTLTFGALIIVRVVEWLVDRIKGGPAKRVLRSKLKEIRHCRELLLASETRTLGESDSEFRARGITSWIELRNLRNELEELDLPTPDISSDGESTVRKWTGYLSGLQVYARNGNLEEAVQLGEAWQREPGPDS